MNNAQQAKGRYIRKKRFDMNSLMMVQEEIKRSDILDQHLADASQAPRRLGYLSLTVLSPLDRPWKGGNL